MEFVDFLAQKKIEAVQFESNEKAVFEAWRLLFEEIHSDSFVLQKKFSINKVRRKYPIQPLQTPE